MTSMQIDYGSVCFSSDKPLTIQEVGDLGKAAMIAGIPANATITSMSFQYGFGVDGQRVVISIGWRISNE